MAVPFWSELDLVPVLKSTDLAIDREAHAHAPQVSCVIDGFEIGFSCFVFAP